jgi:hypothetical protein
MGWTRAPGGRERNNLAHFGSHCAHSAALQKMPPGRPRKPGIEPTSDSVRVSHLLEWEARPQARIILMPPRRIVDAADGPQSGIFLTARRKFHALTRLNRRPAMWRRGRPAIISAIKEGARRHPRRREFALHLCRSDVHVREVRDGCDSLITTRRPISDTDRYDFPQVDRRACSMWRNSARSRRFRARPWRDAALDE